MAAGIGKIFTGATVTLVDMETEKTSFRRWKSVYFHLHNDTIVSLEESNHAAQLGIFSSSPDPRDCFWTHVMLHFLTP